MNIKFTRFSKKENSTARPAEWAAEYQCILKEDSGVMNPVIRLDLGQSANPTNYNYAHIPDFDRWYFVSDWVWSGRLWVARLSVDVLASWAATIKASTQYVTRAASKYNLTIRDNMYPARVSFTRSKSVSSPAAAWSDSLTDGCFVVGLIGGAGDTGAVSYYVLAPDTFKAFCKYLFNAALFDSDGEILKDITESTWKSLFNPFQYVVSAMWFPFEFTSGVPVSTIYFGWYSVSCSCRLITDATKVTGPYNIDVPKHPAYNSGLKFTYLNTAPYAEYTLHCMPWGNIVIDPGSIYNVDKIVVRPETDMLTGKSLLYIYAGSIAGELIACIPAQVGVPVQIAQQNNNILGSIGGAVSSAADTAVSAVSGDILGAAVGAASSIGSAVSGIIPKAAISGAQGAAVGLSDDVYLDCKFWGIAEKSPAYMGHPLMAVVTLSELAGYIKCENANISTAGTLEENRAIINYLNSGCFIE